MLESNAENWGTGALSLSDAGQSNPGQVLKWQFWLFEVILSKALINSQWTTVPTIDSDQWTPSLEKQPGAPAQKMSNAT